MVQVTALMEGLSPELWGHLYVYAQSRRETDGELGSHSYFSIKWNSYSAKKKKPKSEQKKKKQWFSDATGTTEEN